jgi:hypothetical protein
MVRGAHLAPVNLSSQPLFSIADTGMKQQRRGMLAKETGIDSGEQLSMPDTHTPGQLSAGRVPAAPASAPPAPFTMRAILTADRAERAKNLTYQPGQRVTAPPSAFARVEALQTRTEAAYRADGPAAPLLLLGAGVRTLHDLEREWRGRPAAEQAAVLLGVPAEAIPSVFDVAVGFDSLSALITILSLAADPAHPGSIISGITPPAAPLLHAYRVAVALARSPRIELAASFLEDEDRERVRTLCAMLRGRLEEMAALAAETEAQSASTGAAGAESESGKQMSSSKSSRSNKSSSSSSSSSYPMMLPGWDPSELGVFASGAVRDEPGAGAVETEADAVMGAPRGRGPGKAKKSKRGRRKAVDEAGVREVEAAFGIDGA